jgi:hypothetical protein
MQRSSGPVGVRSSGHVGVRSSGPVGVRSSGSVGVCPTNRNKPKQIQTTQNNYPKLAQTTPNYPKLPQTDRGYFDWPEITCNQINGNSYSLAQSRLASKFAAIAPVSGSPLLGFGTTPAVPMPILELHGSKDDIIPARDVTPARGTWAMLVVGLATRCGCVHADTLGTFVNSEWGDVKWGAN